MFNINNNSMFIKDYNNNLPRLKYSFYTHSKSIDIESKKQPLNLYRSDNLIDLKLISQEFLSQATANLEMSE